MNEYVKRAIQASERNIGLQISQLQGRIDHLKAELEESEKERVDLARAHEALLDALKGGAAAAVPDRDVA